MFKGLATKQTTVKLTIRPVLVHHREKLGPTIKFSHGFAKFHFSKDLLELRLIHNGEKPPVHITKLCSEAWLHHL